LQNSGGKYDLIPGGVVIRIHSLRRHAPFATIDGSVEPYKIAIPIEFCTARIAAQEIVRPHLELGIIAPRVGIGDLDGEGRDLLQSLGPGFGRHPVGRLDPLPIDIQEIADESARLLLRQEVARHVELADPFARDRLEASRHREPVSRYPASTLQRKRSARRRKRLGRYCAWPKGNEGQIPPNLTGVAAKSAAKGGNADFSG
jgi:hypothetical protein